MQHSQEFIDLVNASRRNINECNVHDIKQKLDNKEPFLLLDVREESEYVVSFIPSAKHMSRGIIEVKIVQAIPDKDTEIVLYCGGGYRSALAADSLVKMGYTNVASMDGGFRAWNEFGYAVQENGK